MLNKNISIWRGTQTPPTNYHLWEKENGGLYIYLDEKWQHLVTPTDKITLDKHQKQLDKIKNLALTEINPTDNNTYKSYQLKSDDNVFGTTINIPKDRFIKQVVLGYSNATIDSSTGLIDIGTGVQKEYLLFSVALESGKYELVSISLTSFLTERDYADGLEVIGNKIKVKIDPNSEEYISTSTAGIKIKGINNKISSTVDDIKNKIQNGEWLSLRAGRDTDNNIKQGAIAEGTGTTASGENSHAEGYFTTASGKNSHASGNRTNAQGENSHAEGSNTHAKGVQSHTEGLSTKAVGNCSHAQGALNYDDSSFIDMIGVGGNTSNNVIEKNAAVIYVGRDTTGQIDVNAAKNGYQYLIDVGGYQGQEIGDAKSVQEVFADINNVLYTQHARVTLTASPTIIEKGVSTAINLSWQYIYNDKVIIPTSMELKSNNNVLENIKHTYTDIINNTKTYQVTAINEGVTKTSNIITVNAYYPMYFGEGNNSFNQIEVITIANKRPIASSPRGDVSIAFTGGKYLWLCIPSTMSITKVTSSGFAVPMEAPITQTINESYKCYRSTDTINKGTVNFTIL